ncbi:MAG TPA: DUF2130 domain-containing protein [Rhodocyclaceae bacterium]|nr:MAG: DUF2130 domain-containing protein [Rhodocyclales bacterium CG_4_10_14_3_um_filter_68_10]HCX34721.1 DUF2130 domain-containing protein [Rhodocyclaceae bacterium]
MSDAVITCPNCGTNIPVSEALSAQMEKGIEARLRSQAAERLKQAVVEAEARAKRDAAAAAEREREAQAAALASLRKELEDQRARAREAQQAELALRREKNALEERARSLDLEVARKLDAQKRELESSLRRTLAEEGSLKLAEKEKQIEDLKKLVGEMKRKSEQGSQELQGEVLELDIQAALERQFQWDEIRPVPKGMSGADLIQEVRNGQGTVCGRIVWETKNTKHWQSGWLAKLKDDQRAAGGNLAVLVSAALPEGMHEFGLIEGVWVASPRAWPALAVALREQLVQVAFAHAAAEGKQEKMEALYRYLAGDSFRARVQGIVEGFTALQDQLARERRAMEKLWKEREKQIERVIVNTVGMYGEMRGIAGASLPEIPALTLEGVAGLLEEGME